MEQFEILPCHGIFVSLAEKTHVVGALQILKLGGIAPELFVKCSNCARVLRSAVNHFLFAIATDVECDRRNDGGRKDDSQSDDQQQRKQDVSLLAGMATRSSKVTNRIHHD